MAEKETEWLTTSVEDEQAETERDAADFTEAQLREAFVTGTDWTTDTLLGQLRRGNIDINPSFQRREVWGSARKSEFIESVFLSMPIPQIVLAERKDRRGAFIVLDGKQRLLTLRQFCADESLHPEDEGFDPLYLERLSVRKDFNGKSYRDFTTSAALEEERDSFDNHTIRTVVIRAWPTEDYLLQVFLRLNTGAVRLSPQELRQALKPGPFSDFVDDFASKSQQIHAAMGIEGPDFRMRDTEILLRYFAFRTALSEYAGNLKKFLDHTAEQQNAQWASEEGTIRAIAETCNEAIGATIDVFSVRHAFVRWRGDDWEPRFNRAVFDVMTYFFSNTDIANAARERSSDVVSAFIELCKSNRDFGDAISSTTKSKRAVATRFSLWRNALGDVLGDTVEEVPAGLLDAVRQ